MTPCNLHHQPEPGFRRLCIVGAGGFGREVAWLVEQCWGDKVQPVFLVDGVEHLCAPVNGIEVVLLSGVRPDPDTRYVVAVGDPLHRQRLARACGELGLAPATIVHPRAEMSRRIALGAGTIVCAGVIATTEIVTGTHVHINLDCTIGHDVRIGDFSTLAPGVHVSGHVAIGASVYIGTGASVINGLSGAPLVIGDGAVVAAGACVTRSVDAGAMVAGVPAVRKR
jgi:sugar O-acyltransferase (sialic acid O-acetyltransferase NeuD family)